MPFVSESLILTPSTISAVFFAVFGCIWPNLRCHTSDDASEILGAIDFRTAIAYSILHSLPKVAVPSASQLYASPCGLSNSHSFACSFQATRANGIPLGSLIQLFISSHWQPRSFAQPYETKLAWKVGEWQALCNLTLLRAPVLGSIQGITAVPYPRVRVTLSPVLTTDSSEV